MSSCFWCGKKLGVFDTVFYIEKQPTCSSCNAHFRSEIDNIFENCHSKSDIAETRKLIISNELNNIPNDKKEVLTNHIDKIANIYYKRIESSDQKYSKTENSKFDSFLQEQIDSHLLTTTSEFDGYKIIKYNGLVNGDYVVGTGFISDLFSDLSDLTGFKSQTFTNKMKDIKQIAIYEMIKNSISIGGNAIIGIQYNYITFSGKNMIGISVNGTSVTINKISE